MEKRHPGGSERESQKNDLGVPETNVPILSRAILYTIHSWGQIKTMGRRLLGLREGSTGQNHMGQDQLSRCGFSFGSSLLKGTARYEQRPPGHFGLVPSLLSRIAEH